MPQLLYNNTTAATTATDTAMPPHTPTTAATLRAGLSSMLQTLLATQPPLSAYAPNSLYFLVSLTPDNFHERMGVSAKYFDHFKHLAGLLHAGKVFADVDLEEHPRAFARALGSDDHFWAEMFAYVYGDSVEGVLERGGREEGRGAVEVGLPEWVVYGTPEDERPEYRTDGEGEEEVPEWFMDGGDVDEEEWPEWDADGEDEEEVPEWFTDGGDIDEEEMPEWATDQDAQWSEEASNAAFQQRLDADRQRLDVADQQRLVASGSDQPAEPVVQEEVFADEIPRSGEWEEDYDAAYQQRLQPSRFSPPAEPAVQEEAVVDETPRSGEWESYTRDYASYMGETNTSSNPVETAPPRQPADVGLGLTATKRDKQRDALRQLVEVLQSSRGGNATEGGACVEYTVGDYADRRRRDVEHSCGPE
ncbi:uncharacterized protein BDZ99DRAFT_473664 [Mytilinidion resinicola]|uniref:Uncharacterized protein n=1 Tax=Mytilinidion resinicola TaxID=574789 RepID=A0A6A6YVS9_9PEZI|nr:uncharacterized protein BDZ99DRAFT_473664 [Mytilinidion resinicola]KAF2812911.1 hypothetical protein BDZ99DRAFT_473664 [Mytilinidion resinicola]